MQSAWVKAQDPSVTVPMENMPERRIGERPVRVVLTTYYRRQITAGDLVVTEAPAPAKENG